MTSENPIFTEEFKTKRPTVEALEVILGKPFTALNHGFVRVVDYMGDDSAIVQAARVSYGAGTKKVNEDRGLIRYLMRHEHTTPLEMCEIKLHCKMPIFVARQWIRHRTANVNEYSARYSILDKEFYIPEPEVLAAQSKINKQGRDEVVTPEQAKKIIELLKEDADLCYSDYEHMLNDSTSPTHDPNRPQLARELARMNLNLNFYTQWYWKIDLHNLLRFLSLRSDPHAQYEIRVFSDIILHEIVKQWVPHVYEAFEDFNPRRGGAQFSKAELGIIKYLANSYGLVEDDLADTKMTQREKAEFLKKLGV